MLLPTTATHAALVSHSTDQTHTTPTTAAVHQTGQMLRQQGSTIKQLLLISKQSWMVHSTTALLMIATAETVCTVLWRVLTTLSTTATVTAVHSSQALQQNTSNTVTTALSSLGSQQGTTHPGTARSTLRRAAAAVVVAVMVMWTREHTRVLITVVHSTNWWYYSCYCL